MLLVTVELLGRFFSQFLYFFLLTSAAIVLIPRDPPPFLFLHHKVMSHEFRLSGLVTVTCFTHLKSL
ncbi:hypothetical protein [Polycladomyces subterraneus]|uniref:Secreted protein n=1 Tax=Polycladomyces subterraneus TaxID=1016997 RepID=A0ABT8ILD9_9BACL|nr:hypothetical protein [Polycladomyces subterraneus]MDN4593547.1 hypothetical protein [Polycladomyces subterraneus]